jgi:hypothetical protein
MSSLVPTAHLAVPLQAQHQAKWKGEDGALSGRKPPARFGVRKADKRTSPVIAAVAHRFVRLQGTGTGGWTRSTRASEWARSRRAGC